LAELPLVPDCVVLAIPKDAVEEQVAQCADLGVGGVIIYASGFAELGTSDAMAAQARLAGIARESGLRIIGPNTVGIANLTRGIGLHFMPKFNEMPIVRGPIGLVSQSGGLGYTVLQAMQRGVGFSHF
ncbi:CoA-binding protein, partial [Herbaspirillum sp. HC18]